LAFLLVSPALGASDAVLLDAALRPQRAQIIRIDLHDSGGSGQVAYLDDKNAPQSRPAAGLAAIAPADWLAGSREPAPAGADQAGPSVAPGWIELTDGQRLVGRPAAAGGSGGGKDQVGWEHERFGTVWVDLDKVSSLRMPGADKRVAPPAAAQGADLVVLANGDRMEGFIEKFEGTGGNLVIDSGTRGGSQPRHTSVPSDEVALVLLSNPRKAPAPGMRVWLTDGSIVNLESVQSDAAKGRLTLTARSLSTGAGQGAASIELAELLALTTDSSALTSLASLPPTRQWPIGDRRRGDSVEIGPPGPLGAADIVLPGPMGVEWRLPAGSRRIAGQAVLEERSWTWGDCVVTVSVVRDGRDPVELARARVNASRPVLDFNAELPATATDDRLRISVDPGEHGPIQDRIVLRRTLILAK